MSAPGQLATADPEVFQHREVDLLEEEPAIDPCLTHDLYACVVVSNDSDAWHGEVREHEGNINKNGGNR